MKTYKLISRLWRHIPFKRKKHFFYLLIVMIITSFAEMLTISSVLPFLGALSSPESVYYNHWFNFIFVFFRIDNPDDILFILAILFCIFAVFSALMRLSLLYFQNYVGYYTGVDLSEKIFSITLHQPYSEHVKQNTSVIIAGVTKKSKDLVVNFILPILNILSSLFIFIAIVFSLFLINPFITIMSILIFFTVYVLIGLSSVKLLKIYSYRINKETDQSIKSIQEGLGNIRDVIIYGYQNIFSLVFKNADLPLQKSIAMVKVIGGSPKFIIEAIGMVFFAFLAYSFFGTESGIVSALPILGTLALASQKILPIIQQAYFSWAKFRGSYDSILEALILLENRIPDRHNYSNNLILKFQNKIELKNISFNYKRSSQLLFNNLNLDINRGDHIGIMGETGCGKSTLLDLIIGLLEPHEGQINVDGTKIDKKNILSWQKNFAYVPQSIFLSDNTIAENIAFGIPKKQIDEKKLNRVSSHAEILDTINLMSEKFDTQIGERGIKLSGGQKQRIGIARALYRESSIIILDEATSALDSVTEEKILQKIKQIGNKITIFMVAHRKSTLINCNKIIHLKNGNANIINN